jgi:uncharacterized protein involved in outer membrane biogenesis
MNPAPAGPSAAATGRRRGRRRPAWRWAGAALALLAVALVAGEALGWRFLRAPLQSALAAALGVEVRIGAPFRARLLRPPGVEAGALRIGAAAASGAPFLVDAAHVRLLWRWRDAIALRSGERLRVRALEADTLQAHLRRDAEGRASWQFEPPDPQAPRRPMQLPEFGLLAVRDGRLHIDDAPSALTLEARVGVDESTGGRGAGVTLDAQGRWREQPLAIELRARGLQEAAAGDAPGRIDADAKIAIGRARIAFHGQLDDPLGARGIDGRVDVSGPSLAAVGEPFGVTLPSTPPFALRGRLAREGEQWRAEVEAARIGSSRLRGEFRYDATAEVPRLTGNLGGARLAIGDLAPAVGAPPTAPAEPGAGERVLPAREFDLPALRAMDADVRVALDEFELKAAVLAALKPLKAHVKLERGVLTLADIAARTAGGSVAGSTVLDSTAEPAAWKANLRFADIDLAGWLDAARKDRKSSVDARSSRAALARERNEAKAGDVPARSYITGVLQAQLQLSGEGRSTAAILGSLDGELRATVRDGSLSNLGLEVVGLDLAQALGVMARGDESLPLRCAVVALKARDGKLEPEAAVFDTSDTTVTFDGAADLGDETLALRAVALPRDFSVFTLRTPVRIEGTFAAPRISLEKAPIARRVLAGIALGLVNPLAALLPFMDPGDPQPGGCRELVERQRAQQQSAAAASARQGGAAPPASARR